MTRDAYGYLLNGSGVMLVAWLTFAQTTLLLASGTTMMRETRNHLVRAETMVVDSDGHAHQHDTEHHLCPRDEMEKGGDMPVRLSREQQDKVDRAAAAVHLAKAGTGAKLKIGCAFKMASKSRQLILDAVQTWAKK